MKKSSARLSPILLAGSMSILASVLALTACVKPTMCPARVPPPKPTLQVIQTGDGGMCLDRDSTAALARYVLDLETVCVQ